MSEGENGDRFRMGFTPQVRIEVIKSGRNTFEEASRISLNVYSALFVAVVFYASRFGLQTQSNGPTPMHISNIERNTGGETSNLKLKYNKCWICKRMVCRSWKDSEAEQANIGLSNVEMGNYSG